MPKIMGKKIFAIYAENFCLSEPVDDNGLSNSGLFTFDFQDVEADFPYRV